MGQAPSSNSTADAPGAAAVHHPQSSSDGQTCPVDHKSREAWLRQAAQQRTAPSNTNLDQKPASYQSEQRKPFSFFWSSPPTPQQAPPPHPKLTNSRLNTEREVSSIPRSYGSSSDTTSSAHSSSRVSPVANNRSPNNQTSDPHTSPDGNWIYPSEEMFFNAMRRKSHNPRAADMSNVIPIHNAVNEKTWQDILAWERDVGPRSQILCSGPKLVSFSGDSQKLTPRARWNMLLGYERPFDRHDWIVDRCGNRIEYVIDFYAGKRKGGDSLGPSFYLDVRPKLNSWEGFRMRAMRVIRRWTE